ncbi:Carboxyl-terminal protease [hydrothermal vent metagenome]|uniref:Carboxyl-terminal protease n=1 Tax=hydrothermal vent metagenome TaxID=652676 RepID=A0A1W1EKH2_9ZZZZ
MVKKSKKIMIVGFVVSSIFAFVSFTSMLDAKSNLNNKELSKLQAYMKFTEVLRFIEAEYVDEVNTTYLIEKAISGLLTNLDSHSSFLDKKSLEQMTVTTQGEFGGLGISIGMKNGAITVIAPLDDTPAFHAGVKAGDIIIKINDISAIGMKLDEAVSIMRGKPKTPITITVVRQNEPKPIEIKIIRDIINLHSVYIKNIEDNNDTLYIRVSSFDAKVVAGVSKGIKDNPNKKGIILDLRNNPGGLLDQAVGLVDIFVDKGVIVYQKGHHQPKDEFLASKKNTLTDMPIVVLVNSGSASASEIVSGSLQDHKRAIILGEVTFGKGSVQQIKQISDTEAIKLTTARYYLPTDRTIQAVGVKPDIEVNYGEIVKSDKLNFSLKEKDLKGHLERELLKIDSNTTINIDNNISENNSSIIRIDDLYKDAQLKSATDVLKALITMKK